MTKDFNFIEIILTLVLIILKKNTGRLIRYKSVEEENLASNKYLLQKNILFTVKFDLI